MVDKKNFNKEEKTIKEVERIREKYKNLTKNCNVSIPLKIIESYFITDRLARLIFLQVALKKKCFINDVVTNLRNNFNVIASYDRFKFRISRLSEFNLINVHKLSNQKDVEMLNRYKTLKTKCPRSRINYLEYSDNNWKGGKFLKFCLKLEGYPETYEYVITKTEDIKTPK